MWPYDTAVAVNINRITIEVVDVCHKTMQIRDGPLEMPFYVQRRNELLKQNNMVLDSFADPYELHAGGNQPGKGKII